MNYYDRIQRAIEYIEAHIMEPLTLKIVADRAFFSKYHFHRLFSAMTGYTVKEYIRKRRLHLAAHDILTTDKDTIAIALDYHFESQQSFHKAFKKMHGITPGQLRKTKGPMTNFDTITILQLKVKNLKGGKIMNSEIVTIDGFKAVGMKIETSNNEVMSPKDPVGKLWKQFNARKHEIKHRIDDDKTYAVYEYDPDDINDDDVGYTYYLCLKVDPVQDIPAGMTAVEVPASQYVKFIHKGSSEKLCETYDYIDGKWIPDSDYELSDKPDFEVFDDERYDDSSPDSEIDIYVSIK